jgi:hypothetical protein
VYRPPKQYHKADLMKSAALLNFSQLLDIEKLQENIDYETEIQIQKAINR